MHDKEIESDIHLFKELAERALQAAEKAHSVNAQSMLLFVAGGLTDAAISMRQYKEAQRQHGNN